MFTSFYTMIYDLNEGLHNTGLLSQEHSISGYIFMMSLLLTTLLMIGFIKIVLWSEWYEQRQRKVESIVERSVQIIGVAALIVIVLTALYYGEYGLALFLTLSFALTLAVAIRKEFAGVRRFLDEKLGWLF